MSNVSQFFGSGNGATGLYQFHAATISGSFTVRKRGQYIISAIGGGGRGATDWQGGGGAGGIAQSQLTLEIGDVLTYVCGAGSKTAGVHGGTTTVLLNSVGILTANGGSTALNTVGGSGGTASGGNLMNVTGGSGSNGTGNLSAYVPYGTGGGGGAVGVYGEVCNAITNTDGSGMGAGAGTSGSTSVKAFMNALPIGVDQKSEGAFRSTYYNDTSTGGGQINFPSSRLLTPTGSALTVGSYYGWSGQTVGYDRRGHGAGGIRDTGGTFGFAACAGGMFAGGAGYSGQSYYAYSQYGGNGGIFGGGGGAGGYSGASYLPGNGGDGGVIIEWMAYTL